MSSSKRMQQLAGIINESQQQSKYEKWELGLIKAWGQLLYLSYHVIPNSILKIVDEKITKKAFEDYYDNADSDEDLQDWMSDEPPTMNKGFALFDKNRLSAMMTNIANKTKTTTDLVVYRYEKDSKDYGDGWNSYTTAKNDANYAGKDIKLKSYTIPIGYPVIFASGIADENEMIINISSQNKLKFFNK